MSAFLLVTHKSPDGIVAWTANGSVTLRQFLSDTARLAASFPSGSHLLNMCGDRYHFSVGLAAAIVAGKVSLLPPTHTPGMVRQLREFASDVFCLTDSDHCTVALPQLRYPTTPVLPSATCLVPSIDSARRVAVVFTSGSTGAPQPHVKTWGALASCVRAEAAHLEIPPAPPCTIIGTVPPQHMYGFESTVLMAWQNAHALSHAQPFYPADICRALAQARAPRVLVSTPVHLRALLDSGLPLPEISRVVSATAPLPLPLAREVEARCNAPLMEIYGSTETGQIASRRPTRAVQWRLFPGVQWAMENDRARASGGHVEVPVLMNDVIEPISAEHFLLHGRMSDMINIAGKRHSLASLNHLLNTLPGVVDGAFYMPDDADHVTRLAACVVAPSLNAPGLLAALREHVDPVFLPRPLLFLDALPRNSTGKLPREALQALFETTRAHGARNSA